jgi:hypothetical protein
MMQSKTSALRRFRVLCTDPEWIDFLHAHDIRDNVNFWRSGTRRVHLPVGSYFYFWRRGSRYVAGRASFRIQKTMSMSEAWEQFGVGNGVASYENLRRKAFDVLGNTGEILNCLVCDEVKILDRQEYPLLPADFRATNNPKDYPEGSQPNIESAFIKEDSGSKP